MEIPTLKVVPRDEKGKGPARRLRARGLVPAVCYGHGQKPVSLSVDPNELLPILRGPRGLNSLMRLDGADGRTVLVQAFQRDPVERNLLHVDFLSVDTTKSIRREVPIEFAGKSEGVKIGGILQVAKRMVLVEALPTEIPDNLVIDVTALMIGDSLHVADLKLPQGVKALYEQNYAICSVVAPTEEKAAVEEAVPAEGEEGAVPAEGEEGAVAAEGEEGKPGEDKEKAAPGKKEGEGGEKAKGPEKGKGFEKGKGPERGKGPGKGK